MNTTRDVTLSTNENDAQTGHVIYCGAHYKLCPVEVRELWSQGLNTENGIHTLKNIIDETLGISEFVAISTCNRFDLCLFGNLDQRKIPTIFTEFANWTLRQLPNPPDSLRRNTSWNNDLSRWIRIHDDESALLQLFRVAASLDSLVLGEPHILGQLKDSYQRSASLGFCQQEATAAFNKALQVAKRVRTETELGKNAVSIGHAAVEIIQRIFENLKKQKCLVIGAGEMGKISAQHLKYCGAEDITIANRSLDRAVELCTQLEFSRPVRLQEALSTLYQYDVIITATASQEFLIKAEHSSILQKRKSGLPAVIVDISVPRNVAPELGQLQNIFVFDVDDLDKVMESSRQSRKSAAEAAEQIIAAELADYLSQKKQRKNLSNIGKFHKLVNKIAQKEIRKSLRKNEIMNEDQVLITAEAIAKKLVAHAASLAKSNSRLESDSETVGDALQFLFNLKNHEEVQ
jgi:glutamyl-tRNA reductase